MAHTDKDGLDARTRATQERRKSGGYGSHADKRTKRNRTRSAQNRNAIKEYAA
jgi:hypothetical protein